MSEQQKKPQQQQQQQRPKRIRGKNRGGRGGGRRPGRGSERKGSANGTNENNGNGNKNTQPPKNRYEPVKRQPKQQKAPSTKRNGEKGADSHTVPEKTRIRFTRILMNFRENDEDSKYEFDADLTNTERKFLHELALQLGLKSKSTGKGSERRIVVRKRDDTVKRATGAEGEDLPLLNIGKDGEKALVKHLSLFPPTPTEELESRETGASLVAAMTEQRQEGTGVLETLNRLGLDGNGAGQHASKKNHNPNIRKRVDVGYRKGRHAFYQNQKRHAREYKDVLRNRSKLPAHSRQSEIVATVAANPVTIIQGETGCGKSTQCPQFLLDANPEASIAVTQPRRISAISIAERVAEEQCLGAKVGSLVGYQVRLDSATSKDTQLLFLTPGLLLRKLQSSPMLSEYTHIVIDEVHERDKYTEFLLIRLRDLLPLRPDLRLVLMSATLQTEILMDYFAPSTANDSGSSSSVNADFYLTHPPVMMSIEGRTFPVQEFFLEHALEVTNFIDIDAFEDDVDTEDTEGARTVEKPTMSTDQLEAALAKLVPSPDNDNDTAAIKIMAMCAGLTDGSVGENPHVCQENGIGDSGVKTAEFSSPELLQANALTETNVFNEEAFEEYDDYDVDGCQEATDYNFEEFCDTPTQNETSEPSDSEKWDGEGLFKADVDQEVELTPKQEKYLKCYQTMYDDEQINTELLVEVMHYITKMSQNRGAILVFLPGWQEISEVKMLLENTVPFKHESKYMVLPLHSGIPSQDQRKVLRRPPGDKRKIILSTNIAETSLTIDDVAFVIDTGRAKEKDYDPHLKTSTLQPVWISQSSSKQRKGRAGRTKAGVCFHLFSSRRHQSMRPFVESELLRTPLEEMCLMTKKLGLAPGGPEDDDGIPAFLSKALTPPHAKSISNALELLVNLGAILPETNDLTTLGECLSVLSLEPRVGKMVIWSYLLGCSKVASQMAVAMGYKSPFVLPPPHMRQEAENSKLKLSEYKESDQVTVLNAIRNYEVKKNKNRKGNEDYRQWCKKNFLSPASLQMIGDMRHNLKREMSSLGFADPTAANGYHNRHSKDGDAMWQASIAAGLYPNVATRKQGETNFSTMTNRKAKIHVSSVNALKGQPLNSKCQIPKGELEFVCFGEMVKGSSFFTLSQTTHLPSVLPILLLCGTSLSIKPIVENEEDKKTTHSILNLDDWIIFRCTTEVASRLVILRSRLEGAFWNVIARPSQDPKHSLTGAEHDALETLGTVLNSALGSSKVRAKIKEQARRGDLS